MARSIAERSDIVPILGEIFRRHGYEGTTLSLITEETKLGKGSLYHFFPGGKEEMAAAVLADIDAWFEANIFDPLRYAPDAAQAIEGMINAVEHYFHSGRRVCLIGVMALGETRNRFAEQVSAYFAVWINALATALMRAGKEADRARLQAEEAVSDIQGALVLARALNDPGVFTRALERIKTRLLAA